jgi:hypothetical protein
MFGIVSIYMPLLVNIAPLGAVYESHIVPDHDAVDAWLMVALIVITLSHPDIFGIVSMYIPLDIIICPLGAVYIPQALTAKVADDDIFRV